MKLTGNLPSLLEALISGFRFTASLVVDPKGSSIGPNGNSKGLGNATDLELLKALRRNSKVVLTSGRTFRADQYRFPSAADLAVLTREGVSITVPEDRRLLLLSGGYQSSFEELRDAYGAVHVEFGETGIRELVSNRYLDALFISSTSADGVEAYLGREGLDGARFELADLFLAVVAWHSKIRPARG